jgi:hypothetical protein
VNGITTPSSGYTGPKDFPSIVQWWKASHPASAPDIPGLTAFLNAQGLQASNAVHNGMQSDDKLIVNGQMWDLGSSFGGPGAQWFDAPSPVGAGGDLGSAMGGVDPSFLAAWTQRFTPPDGSNLPGYAKPPAFSYGDFQAPTADSIYADPSYQFRRDEGRGQLEASASARGLTNSGGTLEDILKYGQNFASQEYGNIFNRALNTYGTNRANAADAYSTNYQTQFSDPYAFQQGNANTSYSRAWQEYLNNQNSFRQNEDAPFQKLYQMSNLGLSAASA